MKNDLLARFLGNWQTTAAGTAVGAGQYLASQGLVLPHDQASWIQFILGLLVAMWGAVQKDATTGSKPGQPSTGGTE